MITRGPTWYAWDFTGIFSDSIRTRTIKFRNADRGFRRHQCRRSDCCTGEMTARGSFFEGPNLLAAASTPQLTIK